jgi:hypothetical protein
VAVVALALAAAPGLQVAALLGGRWLAADAGRPWSWVAYGLLAPYVAALLWRRHPRARFAAYLFLTHEVARGLHAGRPDAVLVALAAIALLQLPSARRHLPPVRPADLGARLRARFAPRPPAA